MSEQRRETPRLSGGPLRLHGLGREVLCPTAGCRPMSGQGHLCLCQPMRFNHFSHHQQPTRLTMPASPSHSTSVSVPCEFGLFGCCLGLFDKSDVRFSHDKPDSVSWSGLPSLATQLSVYRFQGRQKYVFKTTFKVSKLMC